jgi:hypothetical protein
VNDVDWARVVEEIKDVGLSQLNAVRSYLRLMLVYLLKLRGWPESPAAADWDCSFSIRRGTTFRAIDAAVD